MGIERESKVRGITAKVFVTPWDFIRILCPRGSVTRLDIPGGSRRQRTSLGSLIYCQPEPDTACIIRAFRAGEIPGGTFAYPNQSEAELFRLSMNTPAVGTEARYVSESWYPDGLLMQVGVSVTFMIEPLGGAAFSPGLLSVQYRYEDWS